MILTWFLPLLLLLLTFFANMMILASHPVRSVLALMGCFLGTSILWLMMGADFLAFVLIFVCSVQRNSVNFRGRKQILETFRQMLLDFIEFSQLQRC